MRARRGAVSTGSRWKCDCSLELWVGHGNTGEAVRLCTGYLWFGYAVFWWIELAVSLLVMRVSGDLELVIDCHAVM